MTPEREISVSIPAISSPINFAEMTGEDRISQAYRLSLLISTPDLELKPGDVLGTQASITVKTADARYFHGWVTEFGLEEIRDDLAFFRMTLRPPMWFLSLRHDNRIFQHMTVPEIVGEVCRIHSEITIEARLSSTYDKREYCVQYGESDLDFVQRLLEHEGIFYVFEHAESALVLVLCDDNSALKPHEDAASLPYEPDSRISFRDGDFITHWRPRAMVRSGQYAHTDYNFEKPALDLMAVAAAPLGHKNDAAEVYHHPGNHLDLKRGDALATLRLEERQADHIRIHARGTARHLWPGRIFSLTLFPREAENDSYLVVEARYRMWDDQVRSGQSRADAGFEVETVLSPTRIPFRPARMTPKPQMRGPQTAVVVGPAGAEIFTDPYSRVKVRFHWDRQGKGDENTSCFVRVSSVWAGAGWGFIQIPRIGQEVIVDFLEGDPDQPIITGRVYNNAQMPPYALPGNATQSGWKSNSSPGGGGWNELRFEDKAGAEEVYFQAQKDHVELIKNDESRQIGHDFAEDVGNDAQQSIGRNRTETVGHDKSVSVANNRSVSIGVNDDEVVGASRTLSVGSNETISIGSNSTETIGASHAQTVALTQTVTVGAARADTVGGPEVRTVGASQTMTVGAARQVTVGAGQSHAIGASDSWRVASAQSIEIGADQSTRIGGKQMLTVAGDQGSKLGGLRDCEVAKDDTLKIGGQMGVKVAKSYALEAADSISLKCGSAALVMKKDGTITIEGKDITLTGSGKINVKASGEVTVKGSKINNN